MFSVMQPNNVVYVNDPYYYRRRYDSSDAALGLVAGAAIGSLMWGPLLWWWKHQGYFRGAYLIHELMSRIVYIYICNSLDQNGKYLLLHFKFFHEQYCRKYSKVDFLMQLRVLLSTIIVVIESNFVCNLFWSFFLCHYVYMLKLSQIIYMYLWIGW